MHCRARLWDGGMRIVHQAIRWCRYGASKTEGIVTESMLLPADVGAAISLREMAYAWEDPLTTEGARSLDFLAARAVQLANGLQLAWSLATEDGKVWESGGCVRRMQAIDFLATVVVDTLTRTQEMLDGTRAKHPDWVAPPRAAEIGPCLQTAKLLAVKVRETLDWLNRPRPPVSEEMLRRSRASYDRGEGEPVGEVIARLGSGGPLG
jgi:hypothetical protein